MEREIYYDVNGTASICSLIDYMELKEYPCSLEESMFDIDYDNPMLKGTGAYIRRRLIDFDFLDEECVLESDVQEYDAVELSVDMQQLKWEVDLSSLCNELLSNIVEGNVDVLWKSINYDGAYSFIESIDGKGHYTDRLQQGDRISHPIVYGEMSVNDYILHFVYQGNRYAWYVGMHEDWKEICNTLVKDEYNNRFLKSSSARLPYSVDTDNLLKTLHTFVEERYTWRLRPPHYVQPMERSSYSRYELINLDDYAQFKFQNNYYHIIHKYKIRQPLNKKALIERIKDKRQYCCVAIKFGSQPDTEGYYHEVYQALFEYGKLRKITLTANLYDGITREMK